MRLTIEQRATIARYATDEQLLAAAFSSTHYLPNDDARVAMLPLAIEHCKRVAHESAEYVNDMRMRQQVPDCDPQVQTAMRNVVAYTDWRDQYQRQLDAIMADDTRASAP
ncbi:MAG TPA: hypothetical protein VHQ87_10290 [Rhizobacter sp.]|jgi:hypothetical protein|nr:hypothetical protein [Rhizobacter sp.]